MKPRYLWQRVVGKIDTVAQAIRVPRSYRATALSWVAGYGGGRRVGVDVKRSYSS